MRDPDSSEIWRIKKGTRYPGEAGENE